jgi:hypothetical protein
VAVVLDVDTGGALHEFTNQVIKILTLGHACAR